MILPYRVTTPGYIERCDTWTHRMRVAILEAHLRGVEYGFDNVTLYGTTGVPMTGDELREAISLMYPELV